MKQEGLVVTVIAVVLWILILAPMFGISIHDITGTCMGESWECGGQDYAKPLHRGNFGGHD